MLSLSIPDIPYERRYHVSFLVIPRTKPMAQRQSTITVNNVILTVIIVLHQAIEIQVSDH